MLKNAAEHDARIRQFDERMLLIEERHLQLEVALAQLVGVVDRLAQSQIELRALQAANEERFRATDERINKLILAIERTARGNGHRAGSGPSRS